MNILRVISREGLIGGSPLIEIRASGGVFTLSLEFADAEPSYLDGTYPSAASAEHEGVLRAERDGLSTLYVVTPDA